MISKHLAARLITYILCAVVVFQTLLIVGLPLGEAAFGGQHRVLPAQFRITSFVSILLYLLIIYVLRAKAGLDSPLKNKSIIQKGPWIIFGIFILGFVMNAISKSHWENFIWAPILLFSTYLAWIIAKD